MKLKSLFESNQFHGAGPKAIATIVANKHAKRTVATLKKQVIHSRLPQNNVDELIDVLGDMSPSHILTYFDIEQISAITDTDIDELLTLLKYSDAELKTLRGE
jgi:hypothetical protein